MARQINAQSVSWQWWASDGTPGTFSREHLMEPRAERTLCGVTIPWEPGRVASVQSGWPSSGFCRRCQRIERKRPDVPDATSYQGGNS